MRVWPGSESYGGVGKANGRESKRAVGGLKRAVLNSRIGFRFLHIRHTEQKTRSLQSGRSRNWQPRRVPFLRTKLASKADSHFNYDPNVSSKSPKYRQSERSGVRPIPNFTPILAHIRLPASKAPFPIRTHQRPCLPVS